jgi:hypothetical protein
MKKRGIISVLLIGIFLFSIVDAGEVGLKTFNLNGSEEQVYVTLFNFTNSSVNLSIQNWLGTYNHTDINGVQGLVRYFHLDSNILDSMNIANGTNTSYVNVTEPGFYNNSMYFNGSQTFYTSNVGFFCFNWNYLFMSYVDEDISSYYLVSHSSGTDNRLYMTRDENIFSVRLGAMSFNKCLYFFD